MANSFSEIEAFAGNDALTELGVFLAEFPMDPRLTVLLVNGILLKCLDPALTLAAALSHRDPCQCRSHSFSFSLPFRCLHVLTICSDALPTDQEERTRVQNARQELAGRNFSDHYLLIRVCQCFERAFRGSDAFCARYGLSSTTLEMIQGIKSAYTFFS